jgi:hypothetical protein
MIQAYSMAASPIGTLGRFFTGATFPICGRAPPSNGSRLNGSGQSRHRSLPPLRLLV